jgi:hypothetical protein
LGGFGSAAAGFGLSALEPGRMTMQGHYDDVQTPASYTITHETCSGQPCIHAVWTSDIKQIDMFLWPDGRPIRTRLVKPRAKIEVRIEYDSKGARYHYTEKGQTTDTRIVQADLLEALAVDFLFLAYPFERGGELTFYGIDADSDDGDVYQFWVERVGQEQVVIQGKPVEAHKLKMSIKGFVGLFAPNFYFWYSVDRPHRYLKYSGPDEEFVLTGGQLAL